MKALKLEGYRFGRLLVIKRIDGKTGYTRWLCHCDCGKERIVIGNKLTSGSTISCGCAGLEHATRAKLKHGDALFSHRNRLYNIWAAMKRRCYNKNCDAYPYYGGKGIEVCKSWHDYVIFKKWAVENGYADDLTIDRLDPDKNYCPSNCRWVTKGENIGRAKMLPQEIKKQAFKFLSEGMQYKDICIKLGISVTTLRKWRCEKKLFVRTPYSEAFKQLIFCLRKEGMRAKEILEISGIGESTLHQWIKDAGIS